jgi:phospholipase C
VGAYDYLARMFAVCDRWFASLPGAALPNWLFALSGVADAAALVPNSSNVYESVTTIFDHLDHALHDRPAHVRWGYYFHDFPMLGVLGQHLQELSPRLPRRLLNFLGGAIPRIRHVGVFFEHARLGELPALSWIDPRLMGSDLVDQEQPLSDDSVLEGQALVARVYHAILEGGDDLWRRTLLVITHAAAGGCFDHVTPAESGDSPPHDRFGRRVPAIVVSAWTPPVVDGAERDHACLIRAILDRFAAGGRLPTRVARAATLDGLLSLRTPRRDAGLIPTPAGRRAARPGLCVTTMPAKSDLLRAYHQALRRGGL